MLTTCRYCGRIHPKKHTCAQKPKRYSRRTEEEQGRYTYAFAKKSEQIKARSNYLCAVCLEEGRLVYDGLETHHIIKLRDRPDLLLEDSNLICLCADCHRKADAGLIPVERLRGLAARRDGGIPPSHRGEKKWMCQNRQRAPIDKIILDQICEDGRV